MSAADRPLIGIAWATGGVFTASVLLALPKFAASDLSPLQITAMRYIAGMLTITPFFLAMLLRERRAGLTLAQSLNRGTIGWHVLRAVFAVTRLTCSFYAVTHMAFANAQAITLTNAVFMIVFAMLILGERAKPSTLVAAAICFAGALIAAEPSVESGDAYLSAGAVAALAGAAIWGLESMVIKHTAARDNVPTILFIVNTTAFLLIVGPGLLVWQPLTHDQWILLALMGPLAILTQSVNVLAFRAAPANVLAPFRYLSVLFGLLIGWFAFSEWPSPGGLIGMALILAGGLMLTAKLSDRRVSSA